MDQEVVVEHRLRNALHTALLLGALFSIVAGLGWSLLGRAGLIIAGVTTVLTAAVAARASWRLELWLVRARPLHPAELPELFALTEALSARAKLPSPPHLFYVPTPVLNAFTVGRPGDAALALTDGLLRQLSPRELLGVVAHEIAHIKHRDLRIIALANAAIRITRALCFAGWVGLLINIPAILIGQAPLPWLAIAIMVFAPNASALLMFALSRAREYDADAGAVELTGDPEGLASALNRLELVQRPWWTVFMPGGRAPEPSILKTHPNTAERVARLQEMATRPAPVQPRPVHLPQTWPTVQRPQRRPGVILVLGPGQTRPARRRRW